MDKVILVTLYRRPEYTARMLGALEQCYGIDDYHLFFSIDRDEKYEREYHTILTLARGWQKNIARVYVHSPKLGIDLNKLWALDTLFAETDFVICLEDDMLPAKDFLRYMEWGRRAFEQDKNVLSICGYNKSDAVKEADLYKTWATCGFHAWGWGIWKDRYERFFGEDYRAYREYAGDEINGRFDWYLAEMARTHDLRTIKPVVARIQNFGENDGEHTTPETFANDHNPFGAWEMECPEHSEWELPKPMEALQADAPNNLN